MSKNYLTEAFKELDLLESQSFDVDKKGTSELEDFLEDDSLDDFEVVIDPEAETEEDLQKSYMGKVILMCDVCRSMIYKDPAEIVIDEESQLANVGELCPYCFTGDGYKIVGKVAPYEEVTVEAEKPVEVKVDGEEVEVEDKINESLDQNIDPDLEKYRKSLVRYIGSRINTIVPNRKDYVRSSDGYSDYEYWFWDTADYEEALKVFKDLGLVTSDTSSNWDVYTYRGEDGEGGRIEIWDMPKVAKKLMDRGFKLPNIQTLKKTPIYRNMAILDTSNPETVSYVEKVPSNSSIFEEDRYEIKGLPDSRPLLVKWTSESLYVNPYPMSIQDTDKKIREDLKDQMKNFKDPYEHDYRIYVNGLRFNITSNKLKEIKNIDDLTPFSDLIKYSNPKDGMAYDLIDKDTKLIPYEELFGDAYLEEEIQQDQKFPVEHEKAPVMEDLDLDVIEFNNPGQAVEAGLDATEELLYNPEEVDKFVEHMESKYNLEGSEITYLEDFVATTLEGDNFHTEAEKYYRGKLPIRYARDLTDADKAYVKNMLNKCKTESDFEDLLYKAINNLSLELDESFKKRYKKYSLKESMDDISITTEDQVIKIKSTPREDKETIQPVTETEVEEAKEVEEGIPTEEVKNQEEEIVEEPEEIDVDLDEIDEEGMDDLGESYLKSVYENVNSFKTSKAILQGNKMILEGVISFTSGNKAKTKFIFESKEATKRGKLKFLGENKNISKNKKAFTLIGSLNNKKLMLESLNYNYTGKDSKTGKTKRLYGTIRRKLK